MSSQLSLLDTHSVISSPVSGAGPTPYALPDGLIVSPSGPDHVHVNLSALQALEKEITTRDPFGGHSAGSSRTVALQRSLESRLRARLDVHGSPEYALTWKHWAMQSGPQICALRASRRLTRGKGCFGWPTVTNSMVTEQDLAQAITAGRSSQREAYAESKIFPLAGWVSPMAQDGTRGGLPPRPQDTGVPLSQLAALAGWATPTVQDAENNAGPSQWERNSWPLNVQASGTTTTLSPVPMEKRGALNPDFCRWLMGYPDVWASSGATAMRSCLKLRRSSSKRAKRRENDD